MFADNEKISPPQLKKLLFLDWTGKFCLLLPVLLKVSGWDKILALILGSIWTLFYAGLLGKLSMGISGEFTGYLTERLGRYTARAAGLIAAGYLLFRQIYLARAAGRVCRVFLLPEGKEEIIGVLFLLAGLAAAEGSVQKRARAAQCLFPAVLFMIVLMLAAASGSFQPGNLPEVSVNMGKSISGSACVLAAFSGMGIVLYQIPYVNREKRRVTDREEISRAMLMGTGITALLFTALFFIMLGAFGEAELEELNWPVLVLMSNVNLPGGFLQRWDVIFLSVVLLSLLTASGTGIYYMGTILKECFPKYQRKSLLWLAAIFSGVGMLLAGNYENAERLFVKWGFCAAAPVLLAGPVLLWMVENVRRKRKKTETGEGKEQRAGKGRVRTVEEWEK